MKRSDDVFFFTLIDFLLQVFFFGLVLYVLSHAIQMKADKTRRDSEKSRKDDIAAVKRLEVMTGVSNLTELTDLLTNLGPINELKGTADFISRAGGAEKVKAAVKTVEAMGGATAVNEKLAKLRKFEEGAGKPPCLFSQLTDKKVPRPLATVVANDTTISFEGSNPDLEATLALLGRAYPSVRELSLNDFRKAFAPLLSKKPDCRYTLRFRENTKFVFARDAAQSSFYLIVENVK
jgi:hypothetical protein